MAMAYLQIFADMEEELLDLTDAAIGELIRACMDFQFHDRVWSKEEFATEARYKWSMFKRWMTGAAESYAAKVANGKKGGRPRAKESGKTAEQAEAGETSAETPTASAPMETETKPKENRTETETKPDADQTATEQNQVTGNKKQEACNKYHVSGVCSNRPTREEVEAELRHRNTHTDIDSFMNYNERRGWYQPWQESLTRWLAHDGTAVPGASDAPQTYHQRPDEVQDGQVDWLQRFLQQVNEIA